MGGLLTTKWREIMQEIKFNINDHVKVKLTDYGIDILRGKHEALAKH